MRFENFESKNKEGGLEKIGKYHYVYKDNFGNGRVIFECDAENILEADEEMERQTGIIPANHSNIGCSFNKNL